VKLALIPPRGFEAYALKGDAHLILAQIRYREYEELYGQACSEGGLTILDNGANEGQIVSDLLLMQQAGQYGVREIVVPDVIGSRDKTVQRARRFWQNVVNSSYPYSTYDYMAVAQGTSLSELFDCVATYSKLRFVTTIGIPRHLLQTAGTQMARITLAKHIRENYGNRFQIHFLGTNPSWLAEVHYAAREVPFVRSVDTSAPFNYAIAGVPIKHSNRPIKRPEMYFDVAPTINTVTLNHNIRTMRRWLSGAEQPNTEAPSS
jgi:hypothetical protein